MVRMGSYNLCDGFQELRHDIDQCHLAYLDMEESSEKIDLRNKLEEYIQDFLCVVEHRRKFIFPETNEVLFKSASSKKDFSAYKAAFGFNAIQMYAGNLIAQPWRKEYRQIKTYCGFYKHQIEANLVDPEVMFEALGYTNIGNGLLVLDGPVCVDRVMAVSKDCLVAYVECQMLKLIWEEVSTLYKISWLDVLKFRSMHICSPEQSIKNLKYKYHQRQYQDRSYSQGSDPYGSRCQPVPISNNVPMVMPMNNSFPPVTNQHVGLPPPRPDYLYGNGCCGNNYGSYGPNYSYTYSQAVMKPPPVSVPCNPNGYCCNAYMPPAPCNYQQLVPTANLIEVESHNGSYDIVDSKSSHKPRNFESPINEYYKTKTTNAQGVINNLVDTLPSENTKDSQLEDWDYVYRNLESQGYSKDLGERGDLLSPSSFRNSRDTKKVKATNLDEQMNNWGITSRPVKTSESFSRKVDGRKKQDLIVIDKENSSASSYDNIHSEMKKQIKPNTSNSIRSKSSQKEVHNNVVDKGPQNKDDKFNKKKSSISSIVGNEKWQCKACTFLNEPSKDICDICCKSRIITTEPPMEIGGAECPKCTLVNPKNLKVCQVCGGSLENSPTYI